MWALWQFSCNYADDHVQSFDPALFDLFVEVLRAESALQEVNENHRQILLLKEGEKLRRVVFFISITFFKIFQT